MTLGLPKNLFSYISPCNKNTFSLAAQKGCDLFYLALKTDTKNEMNRALDHLCAHIG